MEGEPSPWDMQSAGLLQSQTKVKIYHTITPMIFLFLAREILIWLLPDKDCVEILEKDMCSPEVQFLHLWEEIKIPKNEKTTFFRNFRRGF